MFSSRLKGLPEDAGCVGRLRKHKASAGADRWHKCHVSGEQHMWLKASLSQDGGRPPTPAGDTALCPVNNADLRMFLIREMTRSRVCCRKTVWCKG